MIFRYLLALLFACCLAGEAAARVQLKKSNPSINAHDHMFADPEVELLFSEPISEAEVTVTDGAGRVVSVGKPAIEGDDVVVVQVRSPEPPAPFPAGEYKVSWRVKSKATGELSNDSYPFHVMKHDPF